MVGQRVEENENYRLLEDFSVDVKVKDEVEEDRSFSLCFWVYLLGSTTFPATIVRQVHSAMTVSAPFLVLNESKNLMLLPLTLLHKEAPDPGNTASWTEVPNVSTKHEFPLEKWVHVGCEVSGNFMRLHIDGEVVGKQSLTFLQNEDIDPSCPKKMTLFSVGGDGYSVQGYIHHAEVLSSNTSVTDHYIKNPPLQLSIDNPPCSEIDVESDGVWSIIGGKASCRRIFSLEVHLSNAIGQSVNKEAEVVASLVYADDGTPVEQTIDAEAPLLASYDGIEFDSNDRPSKLALGRAIFKLKISQLSSKCDNRLFCIKFKIPSMKRYPFLEAFSNPIRCMSRTRNTRTVSTICKRTPSNIHSLNGSQSFGLSNGFIEMQHSTVSVCKARHTQSGKRVRLDEEKVLPVEQADEECDSYMWNDKQFLSSLEETPRNVKEADNSSTDSESTEIRDSTIRSMSTSSGNSFSDLSVFKYCLGSTIERSQMLKEFAITLSEEKLSEFADQVSVYTGCSHHGSRIRMTKSLIAEGTKVWNLISQNNHQVHWDSAISDIEEHFKKITNCRTRNLAQQDLLVLKAVSGCCDFITQEVFEKLWCWLYPIAVALSRDGINGLWRATSPNWIEGFVTKEEAEFSLHGPRGGLQQPGTFVLRFPTTRSWPHPDAGCIVVTYVSPDIKIRHRLLVLDHLFNSTTLEMDAQLMQKILLEEPGLSRVGRIVRSN